MEREVNFLPEEDLVRTQIIDAIANPMDGIWHFINFVNGEHVFPENRVLLDKLTVPKAKRFYELVKEELHKVKVKGSVRFSTWLQDDLNSEIKEQNTFEHEMAHIQAAADLGVDLAECQLELFFLYDGFGLQLTHQFIPPKSIEPAVKLRVALAPEKPSGPDLEVARRIRSVHPELA